MSDAVQAALEGDQRFPITVELYHHMIDAGVLTKEHKVELIEGVIVAVSPQSRRHAFATRTLAKALQKGIGDAFAVQMQLPLTLTRSEPEPDISVVSEAEVRAAPRHPRSAELVVEVARSSLRMDRAMAPVYAEARVREYWIVDVNRRRVEVFREPLGDSYGEVRVCDDSIILAPVSFPGLEISVASLFLPDDH